MEKEKSDPYCFLLWKGERSEGMTLSCRGGSYPYPEPTICICLISLIVFCRLVQHDIAVVETPLRLFGFAAGGIWLRPVYAVW